MEAKKSHNLPSDSWRARKASGVFSLSLKAWESESWWCKAWSECKSLRSGNADVQGQEMNISTQAEVLICPSVFLFFSSPQWIGWCPPAWGRWSPLLSLLIQILISFGDSLPDTPRNNDLPAVWASCNPVKWARNVNHHSLPLRCRIELVRENIWAVSNHREISLSFSSVGQCYL